MGKQEIDNMCKRYPYECKFLGSHKATQSEIAEMMKSVKRRKCNYTY